MLSLSRNPAPTILSAKIHVLQKFLFRLHALKATLCSPLQFSQRWGQYGQGHHDTIILLKRRSCTKPYQSIKCNIQYIASTHGVNYERRSALSLKLFGTCELRSRDPTFNEIGTFGNQNRYPKTTLSIAHLSNVLQR